jgi:hypothetical protein
VSAIICSCHFNAVGIALSLREVGWRGSIICLKINIVGPVVAERYPWLCDCWNLTVDRAEELPGEIGARVPPELVGAIFFCDERFLEVFADAGTAALFPNACLTVGSSSEIGTILDRRTFYGRLEGTNVAQVPRTVESGGDPWQIFRGPFRTRVWRSWRGLTKLPRGRTIRTQAELQAWIVQCEESSLAPEEWGYQELLSTRPMDVVSVCGWHGLAGSVYRTTRWLRQAGENGWLVGVSNDYPELSIVTRNVLAELRYDGPFELEFVRDPVTDSFKVIELNPRFWMQHRLVGSVLVRRYLGLPLAETDKHSQARYWVNTDAVLTIWRPWREPGLLPIIRQAVWSIPLRESIVPCGYQLAQSAWRKILGRTRK